MTSRKVRYRRNRELRICGLKSRIDHAKSEIEIWQEEITQLEKENEDEQGPAKS